MHISDSLNWPTSIKYLWRDFFFLLIHIIAKFQPIEFYRLSLGILANVIEPREIGIKGIEKRTTVQDMIQGGLQVACGGHSTYVCNMLIIYFIGLI